MAVFDFSKKPDPTRFPCLAPFLHRDAGGAGAPCMALNAANEVAVEGFLDGRLASTWIPRVIEAAARVASTAAICYAQQS